MPSEPPILLLGQSPDVRPGFLAYLGALSEEKAEELRLQECCGPLAGDLTSLQNAYTCLGNGRPKPLGIVNASPSKQESNTLGPDQGAHIESWARHRDRLPFP